MRRALAVGCCLWGVLAAAQERPRVSVGLELGRGTDKPGAARLRAALDAAGFALSDGGRPDYVVTGTYAKRYLLVLKDPGSGEQLGLVQDWTAKPAEAAEAVAGELANLIAAREEKVRTVGVPFVLIADGVDFQMARRIERELPAASRSVVSLVLRRLEHGNCEYAGFVRAHLDPEQLAAGIEGVRLPGLRVAVTVVRPDEIHFKLIEEPTP